jgi:transcriptional regulator GlxA family with amidase domain
MLRSMRRNQWITATCATTLATFAGRALARAATAAENQAKPLALPQSGRIRVAYAVGNGATLIDFAGPWEVFGEVMVPSLGSTMEAQMPFDQYLVGESRETVETERGLQVVPAFSFASAPQPDVIIVGAQPASASLLSWLRRASPRAAVTASVCTGAFALAKTGMLDGLFATTHHAFYDRFAQQFPNVRLVRGVRYVENESSSCAGGLTSGFDLALRIVERYFGIGIADATADYMEYQRRAG